MVKYEQPQDTEPGHKCNLELLTRDPVSSLLQDFNPELREKTTDDSDNHQEDVDSKLAGPLQSETYKPWIPPKDPEYTSDDPLINESAPIMIYPKSEIEEIERRRPMRSWSSCCVWEDFKFTRFRAKGLFLTIFFYLNLLSGWMLAITWARNADRSNWWFPNFIMGSLILSNVGCARVVSLWDRWRDYFQWCWVVSILTDMLGLSMLKVLVVEWRTQTKMPVCQHLSNISSLSSYVIFLITTHCIVVSSYEDLVVFEPSHLVWSCWMISNLSMGGCCLGFIDTFEDDDGDDDIWNRNYWRSMCLILATVLTLIATCTPFMYVCWWPNDGLYGIIFGTLLFICAMGWYLDVSKHMIPAAIFSISLRLIDLGFAIVQLYILLHDNCTCNSEVAIAGGIVAGVHLVLSYFTIGHLAVEIVISILRRCNFYIRDL